MCEANGSQAACKELRIFCPFCGTELENITESISGGDFYVCEKCGAVGFGWHEADQTYHVLFDEPEDEDCDPSFLGGIRKSPALFSKYDTRVSSIFPFRWAKGYPSYRTSIKVGVEEEG